MTDWSAGWARAFAHACKTTTLGSPQASLRLVPEELPSLHVQRAP